MHSLFAGIVSAVSFQFIVRLYLVGQCCVSLLLAPLNLEKLAPVQTHMESMQLIRQSCSNIGVTGQRRKRDSKTLARKVSQ